MKPYTAVIFYLDDHSTLILHYTAETSMGWPAPSDDRAYMVVAVFAGEHQSVYSDAPQTEVTR